MAKDDAAPKEKAAYEGQEVTTMDLDRARVVKGTAYGPGKGIRIPKSVAAALKAEDGESAKAATKQGKGPKK